jgi:hypothetical protein
MEESGALSGVFDDRGKFVYLPRSELESIADFVKRRGRVGIAELVKQTSHLVQLDTAVSS